MNQKKTLQELTLKDNFMFGAVMSIAENCRGLLEIVLGFPIAMVEVNREKSMFYHPDYKGVRLDIYAEDENRTHYNVEMQVEPRRALGKRSRYYHSQVDMELLGKGRDYAELPDTFVIFICDFDPFGRRKYRYTFEYRCTEDAEAKLEDGCRTIFLSTRGENRAEVSESLVKFLEFVSADLKESERNFEDTYIESIQSSIRSIKRSREMGEHFMIFEEMMQDERNQGRAEGRAEGMLEGKIDSLLEILAVKGFATEEIKAKITALTDLEVLNGLLKKAIESDSKEAFLEKARELSVF